MSSRGWSVSLVALVLIAGPQQAGLGETCSLIGVDFDQEFVGPDASYPKTPWPTNWTQVFRFYPPPETVSGLTDESGNPTSISLRLSGWVDEDIGYPAFGDDFWGNLDPATVPVHGQSLDGLDGGIETSPGLAVATWVGLTPGATYEVYIFGLTDIDPLDLTKPATLWINGELGSSERSLRSYAQLVQPVGDEISITLPYSDTAGVAIRLVPAPSTLIGLISMGIMGALGCVWRRRKRAR